MTVAELIAKLQTANPSARVVTHVGDGWGDAQVGFSERGEVSIYPIECDDGEDDADDLRDEPYEMSDVEADADALASAGWGTDEDYGYYGDDG